MTLLEIVQRSLAGLLLMGALKTLLLAITLAWLAGWVGLVYGMVSVALARGLVKLARYPFESELNRSQLWIW